MLSVGPAARCCGAKWDSCTPVGGEKGMLCSRQVAAAWGKTVGCGGVCAEVAAGLGVG